MTLTLPLNKAHVMEELARVVRIYPRPKHAPIDDNEFALDYAQLCGELTTQQFSGAVDAYLKSASKFFPRPGDLLALGKGIARGANGAQGLQGEYDDWEKCHWQDPVTGRWTPCPVCGAQMHDAVVRIARDGTEVTRLKVLHNATVHWKVGIGFSMGAMPGTGGGRYEHRVVDQRPKTVTALPLGDEALERAALQAEGA